MTLIDVVPGHIFSIILLIVPGYFLTLAFFTHKKSISKLERLALSALFSIAFIPLLLLIENQVFRVKIDASSVGATVIILIILGLVGYFMRIGRFNIPKRIEEMIGMVPKEEAFPINPFKKK